MSIPSDAPEQPGPGGGGHAPAGIRPVEFLVVGSPRSGTTVVQRLACELDGVAMPPETHFFTQFAPGLVERAAFPLDERAIAEEVRRFSSLPNTAPHPGLAEEVVAELRGRCGSPLDLFDAIVRVSCGPAVTYGEKTPEHLRWWRPLVAARPELRFVAVVRHPLDVVASNLAAPWRHDESIAAHVGAVHLVFAARWVHDQTQVRAMTSALGGDRVLVLRYEDVVADADAARDAIARFLALPTTAGGRTGDAEAPTGIVLPWETWKRRALGPIDTGSVGAWQDQLTARQASEVATVCRAEMGHHGYRRDRPGPLRAALAWARLGRESYRRLGRIRGGLRWQQERIDATDLSGIPRPAPPTAD